MEAQSSPNRSSDQRGGALLPPSGSAIKDGNDNQLRSNSPKKNPSGGEGEVEEEERRQLPPGWQIRTEPRTGEKVYVKMQRHFPGTDPRAGPGQDHSKPLPEGWRIKIDPAGEVVYAKLQREFPTSEERVAKSSSVSRKESMKSPERSNSSREGSSSATTTKTTTTTATSSSSSSAVMASSSTTRASARDDSILSPGGKERSKTPTRSVSFNQEGGHSSSSSLSAGAGAPITQNRPTLSSTSESNNMKAAVSSPSKRMSEINNKSQDVVKSIGNERPTSPDKVPSKTPPNSSPTKKRPVQVQKNEATEFVGQLMSSKIHTNNYEDIEQAAVLQKIKDNDKYFDENSANLQPPPFDEERFIELVQLFRCSGIKGYNGDVKLQYLNELIELAEVARNRSFMLEVKYDLLPTLLSLLADTNPRIVAMAGKLSVVLSLDSASKRLLFSKAARFMPGIVNVALRTQASMEQGRVFASVVLSNLTEDRSINNSILFAYDGLNILGLLCDLLTSENEQLVTIACNILKNLASYSANLEKIAADKTLVEGIKAVLDSPNERARRFLLKVLLDMSLSLRDKDVFLAANLVTGLLKVIVRDEKDSAGVYNILIHLSLVPEVGFRLPRSEIVRSMVPSLLNKDISGGCQLAIYQLLLNLTAVDDDALKTLVCSSDLGLLPILIKTLKTIPHSELVINSCAIFLNCASVYEIRCVLVSKMGGGGFIDCLINLLKKKFTDKIPVVTVYILIKLTSLEENMGAILLSYSEVVSILPILSDDLIDSPDEQYKSSICSFFLNIVECSEPYVHKVFIDKNIVATLLYVLRSYDTNPSSWPENNIPQFILSILMHLSRHRPIIECLKYLRATSDISPILGFKGVDVIKAVLIMCLILGNDEVEVEVHDKMVSEHAADKFIGLLGKIKGEGNKEKEKDILTALTKTTETPLLTVCPKAIKVLFGTFQSCYQNFADGYASRDNTSIKIAKINELFSVSVLVKAITYVFTNSSHARLPEVSLFSPIVLRMLQLVLVCAYTISAPIPGLGQESVESLLEVLVHLTFAYDAKNNKPVDPVTGVNLFVNDEYDIILILEGCINLSLPNLTISVYHKRLCLQLLRKLAAVKFTDESYFLHHLSHTNNEEEAPEKHQRNHVVISYCGESSSRDRVLYISRRLAKLGCDVWRQDTGSHMAPPLSVVDFSDVGFLQAASRSNIAVVCVSAEYKLSALCRLESNYLLKLAKKSKIKLAFVILRDVDQAPEFLYGWLGLLIGRAPCFSVSDMSQVVDTTAAILDSLGVDIQPEMNEMTLEESITHGPFSRYNNNSKNINNSSSNATSSSFTSESPPTISKKQLLQQLQKQQQQQQPGNAALSAFATPAKSTLDNSPLGKNNSHMMKAAAMIAMMSADKGRSGGGFNGGGSGGVGDSKTTSAAEFQLPVLPSAEANVTPLEHAWCLLHDPMRLQDHKKMEATLLEIGVLEMGDLELLDSDMVDSLLPLFKPIQRAKFLKLVKHLLDKNAPVNQIAPAATGRDVAIKYFGENYLNEAKNDENTSNLRSGGASGTAGAGHGSDNGFDVRNLIIDDDPLASLDARPRSTFYKPFQPSRPSGAPPSSPGLGLSKRITVADRSNPSTNPSTPS